MNLKEFATLERYKNHEIARQLTTIMKSYDKELPPMHENRLNGLKSGRLKAKPEEIRALMELTGNAVESFRI